ncbi:MAG: BatD family protein [Phycisphaerae bacterium]
MGALVFTVVMASLSRPAPVAAVQGRASGVVLRVDAGTLVVGEVVTAELVCTNIAEPDGPPEIGAADGLSVRLTGTVPNTSTSLSIVNGRSTRRVTYTYGIRIAALAAGTHTIGPITVMAGGRAYRTKPVRIVVRDADTRPDGDKYIFVTMDAQPRSLYVTETLTATMRIGIRRVVINGVALRLNPFRQVLDQRASAFSIFPGDGAHEARTKMWLTDAAGRRHEYDVLTVTRRIRADDVGPLELGPVSVKANYPTAVGRDWFGQQEITRTRRESDAAPRLVVQVKGPPEAGRPADFAGAIGQFSMDVSVRPDRVEQGQPVTLTVAVRGTPLEGVPGPNLAAQAELVSRFDFAAGDLVGDIEHGAKVFRRAIFPKQAGRQTIPPIHWSYFNPRAERYVTVTSDPIPITVDPASGDGFGIALAGSEPGDAHETTLTRVVGGLLPNYADVDLLLADQGAMLGTSWWLWLVAPPVVCVVVTLTAKRRARRRLDVDLARRQGARRRALALLQLAGRSGGAARGPHVLGDVLTTYLSDRFCRNAGTVTPAEAEGLLTRSGANAALASDVARFLERCDAVRYASGPSGAWDGYDAAAAAADVKRWIRVIERTTR